MAKEAGAEIGQRFLLAAHETFSLLATQPQMGWRPRLQNPRLSSLRVFRVRGFETVLILYQPRSTGIDILRVVHGSRNLQMLVRPERV